MNFDSIGCGVSTHALQLVHREPMDRAQLLNRTCDTLAALFDCNNCVPIAP